MIERMKEKTVSFLRWSEKYTGTDMVYLVGNGFWLLSAQAIASVSAFVVTVLLINLLPKETFGQYRFILSIIPILAIFTLPGIGTALTRSVARGAQVNLRTIARVKITWGLLGSLVSILVAIYYFTQGNNLLAYTFGISALFIPFFETFFIYSFYYKGLQNFKTPAIYEAISRILQALLLVATALLTKSVLALIVVFFIGQIATRLFFYLRTLKSVRTPSLHDVQGGASHIVDDAVEYGKKLSIVGVMGTIANNIDKLLVWHFLGAEALAVYVVAFTIPTEVARLFTFLSQLALPKFSKRDWVLVKEKYILYKKMLRFALTLTVAVIFYMFFAKYMFTLLFPEYTKSITITIFVAPLIMLIPVRTLFAQLFLSAQKTRHITAFQIIDFIAQLILFFVFINIFTNPIVGAAFASIVKVALIVAIQNISFFMWRERQV